MRIKKRKSSSSTATRTSRPLPLQIVRPLEREEGSSNSNELQIVDPSSCIFSNASSSPAFTLPRGWSVEERPRLKSKSKICDRYYYEPGTRRQFRSLIAVQRYLNGEIEYANSPRSLKASNEGNNMQIVLSTRRFERSSKFSNERNDMQIVAACTKSRKSASSFGLPDHWVVEEIPRSNRNYAGIVDRYFIEPETGQRFRSLVAAERHIEQMGTIASTTNAKPGNHLTENNVSDDHLPLRLLMKGPTNAERYETAHEELKPENHTMPSKVKWVLGGPGATIWNAFEGESLVPESMRREWSETFFISIHEKSQ